MPISYRRSFPIIVLTLDKLHYTSKTQIVRAFLRMGPAQSAIFYTIKG
jgi:hypothetical protein